MLKDAGNSDNFDEFCYSRVTKSRLKGLSKEMGDFESASGIL